MAVQRDDAIRLQRGGWGLTMNPDAVLNGYGPLALVHRENTETAAGVVGEGAPAADTADAPDLRALTEASTHGGAGVDPIRGGSTPTDSTPRGGMVASEGYAAAGEPVGVDAAGSPDHPYAALAASLHEIADRIGTLVDSPVVTACEHKPWVSMAILPTSSKPHTGNAAVVDAVAGAVLGKTGRLEHKADDGQFYTARADLGDRRISLCIQAVVPYPEQEDLRAEVERLRAELARRDGVR